MGGGLFQPGHLIVVLIIALIIFGPGKLPELGSALGQGIREFKRSVDLHNSTADVSNVAGWMPRLLGLAYASKLYRNNPQLRAAQDGFSVNGNEVAFGTIGDAATSEGHFWERLRRESED